MNDIFDKYCRQCQFCAMESYCHKYKKNPALSLEECQENDFKEFTPVLEDEEE